MANRAVTVSGLVLLSGVAGFSGGFLACFYHPFPLPAQLSEIIAARRFQVVDHRGRVVADLSQRGLDLIGRDGRVRATLRLESNDKGILGFSDARWEGRAIFGFLGNDAPSDKDDDWGLIIYDPDTRRDVISLSTHDRGKAGRLLVENRDRAHTFPAP